MARLAEIPDGHFIRVGGLVMIRQRLGAAIGIMFVTLEDETGIANPWALSSVDVTSLKVSLFRQLS